MEEHPIQGLMATAMESLQDMVKINTIIGEPVESPDGTIIIPVSKIGFGFAAGGSEFQKQASAESDSSDQMDPSTPLPFGGGSGGGASVTPVAFLIIHRQGVKMIHLDTSTHIYEKLIDYAPKAIDKIQQMMRESSKDLKPRQKDKIKNNREDTKNGNDFFSFDL